MRNTNIKEVLYIACKLKKNMGNRFEEFEREEEIPKQKNSLFELIVGGIAVLALLLNLFLVPFSAVLTILSLSTLSCGYFYFSFAILNKVPLRMILKKEVTPKSAL